MNDIRKTLSSGIYDFLSLLFQEEVRTAPRAQKALFQLGVYRLVPVGSLAGQSEDME